MNNGERRGAAVPLEGGPWDGQEIFVPVQPRMPDEITFPVEWHDGTWDNAHWQWMYRLRGTGFEGYGAWKYECVGVVNARGLTQKEIAIQTPRMREWLARVEP